MSILIETIAEPTFASHAEAAARRIPPLWPLSASVAVNPFLGHSDDTLAEASARLGRADAIPVTMPRSFYRGKIATGEIGDGDMLGALAAAAETISLADLKSSAMRDAAPTKAIPRIGDLATQASGVDWSGIVADRVGAWAAGYFDQGQALWPAAKSTSPFASWRAFAARDLTPEIQGLNGFCARVSQSSSTAPHAINDACAQLALPPEAASGYFHALLLSHGGWAQHARYLRWQAELEGRSDDTITDLLAIALVFEAALLAQYDGAIKFNWRDAVSQHAAPIVPSSDQRIDCLLQDAFDRASQKRLVETLAKGGGPIKSRPTVQAAFCIDVRSEVFRRALEQVDPAIETIGFAGFFGLTVAHRRFGSDVTENRLPVLLAPALKSFACEVVVSEKETNKRILARTRRAWGRFKLAAVSSFAFVEASGPVYAAKLIKDAVIGSTPDPVDAEAPRFSTNLSLEQKVAMATQVLKAMSLQTAFAPIVLLVGHGAGVVNNPHAAALQCGACGGHAGDINARLLANLLNDGDVREALPAASIFIPAETVFVAGLHDTTTDDVTLFEMDIASGASSKAFQDLKMTLSKAAKIARAERAIRLPSARSGASLVKHATDWAQVRPEWGLAGCNAFIAAPRHRTAAANFDSRTFLHSYDWKADDDFAVLELILTAPVVVASWISLQYYGSTVAPHTFGGGNKLLHNVVGGLGVLEGNGGLLRAGLPWQSVHDGAQLVHEPKRLSVVIEAPRDAIASVLARHPDFCRLFDNGWLTLFAWDPDALATFRYRYGQDWETIDQAICTTMTATA
ncbi:MAG: DUF2309 domain-containing protein [Hyphomicrobiales bacterium]|nr:MAG: DUF2309 domain-containing protein [Hyphomicrobiales bacterium]